MTTEIKNAQKPSPQDALVEEEKVITTERVPEGIYSDGVYISLAAANSAADETFSDAQSSYYTLLHHRFLLLRSILKCAPPPEAISALDDSHPISFPRSSRNAQREWRRLLLSVDPQTVQLACMDNDSVLGVLVILGRLISENVRNGDAVLVRRIGAWAWGLLSKCRDVGQLAGKDIGDIRELGKRAVRIIKKIREEQEQRDMEMEAQEKEEEDYESDAENGKDDDEAHGGQENEGGNMDLEQPGVQQNDAEELEQAKARLGARLLGSADEPGRQEEGLMEVQSDEKAVGIDVRTQTRAMLDMIITVVGEHYGQRDLLEAREIWTEQE